MRCFQNSKKIIILSMICLLFSFQAALADSLWTDSSGLSMFSDRRAHTVGDILTIVINESSTASRTGNAANSKSGNNTLNAGTGIFHFLASASASASDSFSAKGSLSNSNTVTGRVTVQVTDVKPNGYMQVSGTQMIVQNGEEQKITVSGTVRPEDVLPDNTILSSNVADAKLKIEGNGPIANKQREGILTQIFNILF